MATDPIRFDVPDNRNFRLIPEQFDGSHPNQPVLPNNCPLIHGVGVLINVDKDGKTGTVTGFSFLSKNEGAVQFKVMLSFDDSPKYGNWSMSPDRSLVGFQAAICGIDDDGHIQAHVRQMTYLMEAPRNLLQAVGVGITAPGKAAKMKMTHEAARRRKAQSDSTTGTEAGETAASGSESSGSGSGTKPAELTLATAKGIPLKRPVSPTPVYGTRGKLQKV
ncbi:unnamed protein product [Tilletia caries]|nr:unnamed protein product [Tilletia caries]